MVPSEAIQTLGRIVLSNNGDGTTMLARRFTIVCLMTAIFGIAFASVAARSDGPRFDYGRSQEVRCVLFNDLGC